VLGGRTKETVPLVIAIDEFQTMSGDRNANHAKLLNKIHGGGYPAPIFVIATGLSDTLGVVERMGISRTKLNAVHSLGALSEEESWALIEGWTEHFQIPSGPWQDDLLDMA